MVSKIWRYAVAALVGESAVDIHVGKRVMVFRDRAGISPADLANLLSVSQRQIQCFETGRKRISASQLFILAHHFNVPVAAFFDRRGGAA